MEEETRLLPPKKFPFPFAPYSIQEDLMRKLYETLEEKKLGIFESPTGTGKSMSLICGSLKWLFDAQQRLKNDVESSIKDLNEELKNSSFGSNWLDEHASYIKIKQKKDALQLFLNKVIHMESRLQNIESRANKLKSRDFSALKYEVSNSEQIHNKENSLKNTKFDDINDDNDDNEILLDNYGSIDENNLYDEKSSDSEVEAGQDEKYNGIKIFLCSRTHSQLSQLLGEIKKSPYNNLKSRVVSLASRQTYCINHSVVNLKHLPLINEKCQDLHNKKKGTCTKVSVKGESLKRQKISGGCPYYNQLNIENLKFQILSEVQDVEQLINSGKKLNACPYYASRKAVEDAQIVLVPYNTILHKGTREACGINLKDSVLIIDEAHNLLDALGQIYSCLVKGHELIASFSQLVHYRDKYSERFSALNLLNLNQLIFIVNQLLKKLGSKGGVHPTTPTANKVGITLETLAEFILSTEIDTVNFYKILEFVEKSNIVNKLRSFVEKYQPSVIIHKKNENKGVSAFLKKLSANPASDLKAEEEQSEEIINGNPLFSVITFIQSLTNHCLDGRIVCTQNKTIGSSSLKFLLLNPAAHFSDIVKEARSVVVAGGTMQPFSEFTDQLFYLAGGTPDRITTFTCGHIIPENNILPIILSTGPTGKTFNFSYQQRNNKEMIDELGRLLLNICNVVPDGVVCFFPSYEYENLIYEHFQKNSFINKYQNKKKVLREPKNSNKVNEVLRDYSKAVSTGGALLFSVIGGKLSEGLNFSDSLGRCVIVIGLPFPNLMNPELKEKMNYMNNNVSLSAGKAYYENLCMKAVNQSIGRSVRHKNDYASVLLIDQRFSRPKCIKSLPNWIQKSLRVEDKFGPVVGLLAKFFASKTKI